VTFAEPGRAEALSLNCSIGSQAEPDRSATVSCFNAAAEADAAHMAGRADIQQWQFPLGNKVVPTHRSGPCHISRPEPRGAVQSRLKDVAITAHTIGGAEPCGAGAERNPVQAAIFTTNIEADRNRMLGRGKVARADRSRRRHILR